MVNGVCAQLVLPASAIFSPYSGSPLVRFGKTFNKATTTAGHSVLWYKTQKGISSKHDYVGIGTNNPEAPLSVVVDTIDITRNTNTMLADFQRTVGSSTARFLIYGYPNTSNVLPHVRNSVMLYATSDAKDLIIAASQETGRIRFITRTWVTPENERMVIDSNGNIGIGVTDPSTKLQIADGDVYIDSINSGVIMKSPNGSCWRMTVDNSGNPVFTQIVCP